MSFFFLLLQPHCGPTNGRIRMHFPLFVPDCGTLVGRADAETAASEPYQQQCLKATPRIRVQNQTRRWEQGKMLIIDDSFEHEVWYPTTTIPGVKLPPRLIMIVDLWHPDLTADQRSQLR